MGKVGDMIKDKPIVMVRITEVSQFMVESDNLADVHTLLVEAGAELIPYSSTPELFLRQAWYKVRGTLEEIGAVKRKIRRLARGKPRFKVIW